MDSFLSEVAKRLYEQHPQDLDKVWVVFNNRRPSLFLKRELTALANNALFLPRMMGMDDLVKELGGLEVVPNEFLLFALYKQHCEMHSTDGRIETFESFMPLADMMLSDFSEIDLYLGNAEQIFSNLHNVKELMEWSVEGKELTQMQLDYLSFYKSLSKYYTHLRQTLLERGQAYTGMAYRHAAHLAEHQVEHLGCNKIYFVGFNVLSTCEKEIIKACLKRKTDNDDPFCEIITDGDGYYFDDESQEAGRFLREMATWVPSVKTQPIHYGAEPKDITIVNCPENILQTKYAGEVLFQLSKDKTHGNKGLEKTALVLADENLLLPMLDALPSCVEKANISMGFPFTLSHIHNFTLKLFNLHIRRQKGRFYHIDILDVLTDSNTSILLGDSHIYSRIQSQFQQDRVIYAGVEYILETLHSMGIDYKPIQFLFSPTEETPDAFLSLLDQFYQSICHSDTLIRNDKERESAICFHEIVTHLQDIQRQYRYITNLQTLEKIYVRLAQRHNVSFLGEPLGGLQILGMLETRNLDFVNVIILSTNEGSLPSGRSGNTLIPFDLKRAYQLPTYNEKDAVYAFHFYRLLQRANHITLLYNTETSGITKGEPSRFILQIRDELVKKCPNIQLHEQVLSVENESKATHTTQSTDSKIIKPRLTALLSHGISATSINTYRNCPRQFYYKYLLSLHEKKTVNDDLDSSEVGTVIHEVLKEIHPQGGQIKADALQEKKSRIKEIVDKKFDDLFHTGDNLLGRNHLYSAIAQSQISRFLDCELAELQSHPISIEGLESKVTAHISIQEYEIKLEGRIDRIDRIGNQLRILDYKSGKVTPDDLITKGDGEEFKCPDKCFQVLFYSWLYHMSQTTDETIVSGLIPLQASEPKLMPALWNGQTSFNKEGLKDFEGYLINLLSKMVSPEEHFDPCNDKDTCKYCPFVDACKK